MLTKTVSSEIWNLFQHLRVEENRLYANASDMGDIFLYSGNIIRTHIDYDIWYIWFREQLLVSAKLEFLSFSYYIFFILIDQTTAFGSKIKILRK